MFKSLKGLSTAITLMTATSVFACSIDGKGGFVPENDLYISADSKSIFGGISLEQFNEAIDKIETIYSPIISGMGKKLSIERNWTDGTVNAYAQQSGNTYKVHMFGGLARHQAITQDGFSLVVCHEIGHHIGGAPKKVQGVSGGGWWGGQSQTSRSWASNEGQADYWAALKCLRKAFINDNNAAIVAKMEVPAIVKQQCANTYKNDRVESNLCVRIAMAGKSVSDLFSNLGRLGETKFETPDTKIVAKTDDNHPKAQCRLDTYFQGSLCDVNFNEDVSQTDEVKGTCHNSLGDTKGVRPLCWFKPSK